MSSSSGKNRQSVQVREIRRSLLTIPADIKKAAKDIIDGCTFDNNLPCIAEKECFVMDNVADELIGEYAKAWSISYKCRTG